MNPSSLSGRGIVITRPREHALGLAERVRAAGGTPILFPTIEILAPRDPGEMADVIARLDRFQIAIFISPTAVSRGLEMVSVKRDWPPSLRVAAVGAGTESALVKHGFHGVISPANQADSEALAALAELQDVRGRSIVIFRGEGGREWLRATLEARGAKVEYAQCYRRARPEADANEVLANWRRGGIDAVTATSAEGLENFFRMIGPPGAEYLQGTPTFVPHSRIRLAAEGLGIREVVVTGRGDDRIVEGLAAFFATV